MAKVFLVVVSALLLAAPAYASDIAGQAPPATGDRQSERREDPKAVIAPANLWASAEARPADGGIAAAMGDVRRVRELQEFRRLQASGMKWEMGYLALSAVDTAQTIRCLKRETCEEINPLFGKNPKSSTLIAAKLGGGLLHFAAFRMLSRKNPRAAMRMAQVSAVIQGGVVALNARVAF